MLRPPLYMHKMLCPDEDDEDKTTSDALLEQAVGQDIDDPMAELPEAPTSTDGIANRLAEMLFQEKTRNQQVQEKNVLLNKEAKK